MFPMGARRMRGNSDGGEGRGGDRPHPTLDQAEHASRDGDIGQDRDNAVGESAVTKQMAEIMGAAMVRGKDAWLKRKLGAINEACEEILGGANS